MLFLPFSIRSNTLPSHRSRKLKHDAKKYSKPHFFSSVNAVPNKSLVFTQFIEAMGMLHVKGPKKNIEAVGYYLRADGPIEV
jgi:hypothetical protein